MDLNDLATYVATAGSPAAVGDNAEHLEKVLRQVLHDLLDSDQASADLTRLPAESIDQADEVSASRRAYVLALIRLIEYFTRPAPSPEHAAVQARLALGYARHAETKGLDALKRGRTPSDETAEQTIAALRKKLADIAERRAQLRVAHQNRKKTDKQA